ncbi:hypothetical protein DFH08DRAFT_81865 [Mycena albidolilacea]|uniref:Uncharacterized protein n=1 Tax=Mycena albidolilacea TaxID=1033008 RepID=A0AAD7A9B7_9AGAR|nr:hypothetical protein DFH08DRAFT_81865 [Mycena albidolilacea]
MRTSVRRRRMCEFGAVTLLGRGPQVEDGSLLRRASAFVPSSLLVPPRPFISSLCTVAPTRSVRSRIRALQGPLCTHQGVGEVLRDTTIGRISIRIEGNKSPRGSERNEETDRIQEIYRDETGPTSTRVVRLLLHSRSHVLNARLKTIID